MSDSQQPGGQLPDELQELAARMEATGEKDSEIERLTNELTLAQTRNDELQNQLTAAQLRADSAESNLEAYREEVRNILNLKSDATPPSESAPESERDAEPDDSFLPEHRKRQVIIEAIFQERLGMESSEFRSRTRGPGRIDARDIAALMHRESDTAHAEIASMLDTSPAASHTRTSKASQRLEKEQAFGEEYDQTKTLVEQLMDPEQQVNLNVGQAASEVRAVYAQEYGVGQEEYATTRRRAGRANARRAMAFILNEAGLSTSGIARELNRSEDAVKTIIRRARNQLSEDPKFLREVTRIRIRAGGLVKPIDQATLEMTEDVTDQEPLPKDEEAELARLEETYGERVADTLREVLSEFEVTLEEVQGTDSNGSLVKARSAIFSILFEVEKLPPAEIMQLIDKDEKGAELLFELADKRRESSQTHWIEFNDVVEEIKERIIAEHGFGHERTVPVAEIPSLKDSEQAEERDTADESELPLSEATAAAPYATGEAVTAPEREEERRSAERLELSPELISQLRSQDRDAILRFRQDQTGHILRLARENGVSESEAGRVLDSVTSRLNQLPAEVESLDNWVRSQAEAAFIHLAEHRRETSPENFYIGMKHRYDNVGKQNKAGRENVEVLRRLESNTRRLVTELVKDNQLSVVDKRQQRDLMRNTAKWIYKLERVLMVYGPGDVKEVTKPLHQMPEEFQREVVLLAAREQLERLGSPKRGFLARS